MEFTTPHEVWNTTSIVKTKGVPHVTFASQIVLTLVYITGVVGNISALIILFHKDKVSVGGSQNKYFFSYKIFFLKTKIFSC